MRSGLGLSLFPSKKAKSVYKLYGNLESSKPHCLSLEPDKAEKLEKQYSIMRKDEVKAIVSSGNYLTLYGWDKEHLFKTWGRWVEIGL